MRNTRDHDTRPLGWDDLEEPQRELLRRLLGRLEEVAERAGTTLPDEYAWTRAALAAVPGLSPGWIDAWLQEAAETSWRWRFTSATGRVTMAGQ